MTTTTTSQTSSGRVPRNVRRMRRETENGSDNGGRTQKNPILRVQEDVISVSGWPTDSVSIDHCRDSQSDTNNDGDPSLIHSDHDNDIETKDRYHEYCHYPHTVLLFVPGNPGCIGWYIDLLSKIVKHLGVGYAARGISYAGHGVGESMIAVPPKPNGNGADTNNIAWTVDGQVQHKIDWVDQVLAELKQWNHQTNKTAGTSDATEDRTMPPRFIFISHSIGSHLVQRGLILRPDILKQTELILHLMPFVRFDPPTLPKAWLSTVASSPDAAIFGLQMVSRMTKSLPRTWIDVYMERMAGVEDAKGRQLAIDIAQQPTFAKNFLMLGTEEIRDIPEVHDEAALRIIGRECSTAMLFCGGPDMWAPESHMDDLKESKRRGTIPPNIHLEYKEELLHGFVVFPTMVEPVVSFCLRAILKTNTIPPPISRL